MWRRQMVFFGDKSPILFFKWNKFISLPSQFSGCGVIGSRTRLRIWRREAWGFESLHPHKKSTRLWRVFLWDEWTRSSSRCSVADIGKSLHPHKKSTRLWRVFLWDEGIPMWRNRYRDSLHSRKKKPQRTLVFRFFFVITLFDIIFEVRDLIIQWNCTMLL